MDRELISTSTFLSLVLRHRPKTIEISLDEQGWVEIDELLAAANRAGRRLTRPLLEGWETPPVTDASITRPFEFVLLNSPGLARHEQARIYRCQLNSMQDRTRRLQRQEIIKETENEPMQPARLLTSRLSLGSGLSMWALLVQGLLCEIATAGDPSWQVGPVPDALRERLGLAPFYQKHIAVAGFPIVASAKVSDDALREAAWIVRHVVGDRDDILQAMAANKVRLVVMAWNEYTTDVPEHSQMRPKVFWDRRARGLGATLHNPVVSCAEENVLCYPNDPYSTENILIHEFAHAIHGTAGQSLDADFDQRLRTAYKNAKETGLFKDTYAGSNASEYWAEAVQDWFDDNRENDSLHNHVNTRAELKEYDPRLAELVAEVLGDGSWRYQKPMHRSAAGRSHLVDFDPAKSPRFRWRKAPIVLKPRVLIQTTQGDIEVELDAEKAPITTENFLRYTLDGFYADGSFHRTVTLANQLDDDVKIEVIQASADPAREKDFCPPISLEQTRDTGLRHVDGTISMAREEPDTAQDQFFICIGDQPELDFGGKRNPDGQGFAAFGRVIRGLDVVRRIHQLPAAGQKLASPVLIQRAIRTQ